MIRSDVVASCPMATVLASLSEYLKTLRRRWSEDEGELPRDNRSRSEQIAFEDGFRSWPDDVNPYPSGSAQAKARQDGWDYRDWQESQL